MVNGYGMLPSTSTVSANTHDAPISVGIVCGGGCALKTYTVTTTNPVTAVATA
jgi:hypothetical protein